MSAEGDLKAESLSLDAKRVDLVLHARWVIPVIPRDTFWEYYSVVIHNGKIQAVLPRSEAKQKYCGTQKGLSAEEEESVALIPGLINMHTHAAMTLLRSYVDAVPLMEWLQDYIWPAEHKWVGEEFVRVGTRLAAAEMIRCGTTLFNDMYFFPEVTAKECVDIGMRASVGAPVFNMATAWADGAEEHLHKGIALAKKYADHPLIGVAFAPHAPYTVGCTAFQEILKYAIEYNTRIHTHLHESEATIAIPIPEDSMLNETKEATEIVTRDHEKRPIDRMERLGVMCDRLIAVHMTSLTKEEKLLVKNRKVHVVHCPESNLKLGSGVCPLSDLVEAGVNVCIGTDGAASNDDLDLLGEIRTASLVNKMECAKEKRSALKAHEFLEMATINGARALALEDKIGSIEVGKYADLVAIQLRTEPVYNPITNLVHVGTNSVKHVWINGKCVLRNEELQTLNEIKVLKEGREFGKKIASWAAVEHEDSNLSVKSNK